MLELTLTPRPGVHITRAARDACRVADMLGVAVSFTFNGYYLPVPPGTDPQEVEHNYEEKIQRATNRTPTP